MFRFHPFNLRLPVSASSRKRSIRAQQLRAANLVPGALLFVAVLMQGGCSKDEMKKMATSVQQTTQDFAAQSQDYIQGAVEAVEEQLPSSGSLTIKLDPRLEIQQANVELISIGNGRSNVVQLATYDTDSEPNAFPCVLLHGQSKASDIASLVGETVPCDLYLQLKGGGAVFKTPAGKSVQITFGQLDAKTGMLKASIGSGRLIGSDEQTIEFNGGSAIAIVKGASN